MYLYNIIYTNVLLIISDNIQTTFWTKLIYLFYVYYSVDYFYMKLTAVSIL